MTSWALRDERPGDELAISALTGAAFHYSPFSDGGEAGVIENLRADGDLALSLVAENMDCAIIGHVAFSPVAVSDGTPDWYALGPISVIPLQRRVGIGAALVRKGLARLQLLGARGCVVLGDPQYYTRFGFEHDPELTLSGFPSEYFQRIVLKGGLPSGEVRYSPAFDGL